LESRVLAVVVAEDGNFRQLTADQARALAAVRVGSVTTLDLGGELGNYRVAATAVTFAPTGAGGVVVTGLPMAEVEAVLLRLTVIIGLVTAVALAAAVVAGAVVVRVALRPLGRVAATASTVADLPLDRGEVALSARVPDADAGPSTEVGKVGSAINRMLGHVASALE